MCVDGPQSNVYDLGLNELVNEYLTVILDLLLSKTIKSPHLYGAEFVWGGAKKVYFLRCGTSLLSAKGLVS